MFGTLQKLRHDHQHIARLLQVLWQQISLPAQGRRPDYEVLRDIMLYMCQYTDIFHHPLEELVFQQLHKSSPELVNTLDTLTGQHQILLRRSIALQETLQTAIHQFILWDDLHEALTEYASLLQDHMDLEDQQIFPVLQQQFSEQDWQDIEQRSKINIDPLFGKDVQDRFRDLYRVLTRDFSETDDLQP